METQSLPSSQEKYKSSYSVSPKGVNRRKKFNKNHLRFGFEYETLILISKDLNTKFAEYDAKFDDEEDALRELALFGITRDNYQDEAGKIYWNALSIQLNLAYFNFYNIRGNANRTLSKCLFHMPYTSTTLNMEKQWQLEFDGSVTVPPVYQSFVKKYVTKEETEDDYVRQFTTLKLKSYLEIVSPVMKYSYISKPHDKFTEIMTHIIPLYKKVQHVNSKGESIDELVPEIKYWNNPTTSTHVHISFPELDDLMNRPKLMIKFFYAWLYFEPLFMMLCGHWRRDNEYCKLYRPRFDSKRDLFNYTIDDFENNYLDFIRDNYPEVYKELMTYKTPGITAEYFNNKVIVALLTIIQGGPSYNDRYFSLNMLNLLPSGIGTFEFRIKQGSNDVEENKMFMLLLGEFVKTIMNMSDGLVSNMYKNNNIKYELWKLQSILIANNWKQNTEIMFNNTLPVKFAPPPATPAQQHTSTFEKLKKGVQSLYTQKDKTPVILHKTTHEIVTSLFKTLFTLIEDTTIKNYWKNIASKLYHIDFSNTHTHTHTQARARPPIEPVMETRVNIEGGREPNINDFEQRFLEIQKSTIEKSKKQNADYYSKLKTSFEEKNRKHRVEKNIVNTSFGQVNYETIQKIMIANGSKQFYKAYLKDTKTKLRPKSV